MTNHTDTSRSDDLVAKCFCHKIDTTYGVCQVCNRKPPADRIEALEAENERLRDALGLADAALRGANMNMNVVERKVRAALGEK